MPQNLYSAIRNGNRDRINVILKECQQLKQQMEAETNVRKANALRRRLNSKLNKKYTRKRTALHACLSNDSRVRLTDSDTAKQLMELGADVKR